MIRRMTALALVFVAGLAIASAASPTPSPAAAAALEGTHWNLVELGGVDAQAGPRILLERKKSKRQLSGSTGCGLMRGGYDLFAGRLRISPDAPNRRKCRSPSRPRIPRDCSSCASSRREGPA